MPESLQAFVGAAKKAGASDEFLAALLTRRGWPAEQVYGALGEYWAEATGVPLPVRAGSAESARDAFLYLLSFFTLGTWAIALGSLLFRFVDHWLPDTLAPIAWTNPRSAMTWQLASIAVAFPIYVIVTWIIFTETAGEPERLKSGPRRWLTWLALLITAGTMIGDLIWFLDSFLTGDLTLRFVLKSVIVFCIAGAICAYYLGALRWDGSGNLAREKSRNLRFGLAALAVVAISLAVGLGVAGTPSSQRHIEADNKRVADLRRIASAIVIWRNQSTGSLPSSLDDPVLARVAGGRRTDPETGAPYEYHPRPDGTYQLCAVFNMASEPGSPVINPFWNHASGRSCFTLRPDTVAP